MGDASTTLDSDVRGDRAALAPQDVLDQLTRLSLTGLTSMYVPGERAFVQTLRGLTGPHGRVSEVQGRNLRYAAISALGLRCVPVKEQVAVLDGLGAGDFAREVGRQARAHADPGAVALAAWALAEVAGEVDPLLFTRLRDLLTSPDPLPTVDVAWMVTAATAAGVISDAFDDIAVLGRDRLMADQGPEGIFPHAQPAQSLGRFRAHVGCFADQVYPIQALARHAAAVGDRDALRAANRCANAICTLQGEAGQWWWHYDSRDGSVVERFPVYSVHQHAMAPMALLDLRESGGDDHTAEVLLGLDWLRTHPETLAGLIDEDRGVVWRKVGRREPSKAARKIAAVTTSLRRGAHLPGVDRLWPATKVDHECRPYELGWLLYAWHSHPRASRLESADQEEDPLTLEPQAQPGTERLFGMPVNAHPA